jgi:aryl-alcohol dehydrogenase-like predicted oxidoreductase
LPSLSHVLFQKVNENLRGERGFPAFVRAQLEASLRGLGIETVGLYYQHRVDPRTPIEESANN